MYSYSITSSIQRWSTWDWIVSHISIMHKEDIVEQNNVISGVFRV